MIVFYTINAFSPFAFLEESANAAGIAVVHSVFNVVATLALLPFRNGLVKLAKLTIPEDEAVAESTSGTVLDARFLEKPAFAAQQAKHAAADMAKTAKESLLYAFQLLEKYDSNTAEKVA